MDAASTHIAIIGAGFSGTLAAIHLLKNGLNVSLIDSTGHFGSGLAYGTQHPQHLLNVPASRMSALFDAPLHFRDWLTRHTGEEPNDYAFAPRRMYGAYMRELLDEAERTQVGQLNRLTSTAIDLTRSSQGWTVQLGDGKSVPAKSVVLALGNPPPARLPVLDAFGSRVIHNPWQQNALDRIGPNDPVLIVGTGLTMVDMAIALKAGNHQGSITAVSRHGLLPQAHSEGPLSPAIFSPDAAFRQLTPLFETVRAKADNASDWRIVIDGLRPLSHRLWTDLPAPEQARFLRHIRPYWDVHRHRIAPAVARQLRNMQDSGQLKVLAGHLKATTGHSSDICIRKRGSHERVIVPATWIINCTGPASDPARWENPLIDSILRQGLVRSGPHRLGLDVNAQDQVIGKDGQPVPHLYATGPISRGHLWEITSVPDIRERVASLAAHLAAPYPG